MKPFWLRSRDEQAAVLAWVQGSAPPPLQAAQQARQAEQAAYRAARAHAPCDRCGGTTRVLVVVRDVRGFPLGRAAPCPACRPEDAVRVVEQLGTRSTPSRAAAGGTHGP